MLRLCALLRNRRLLSSYRLVRSPQIASPQSRPVCAFTQDAICHSIYTSSKDCSNLYLNHCPLFCAHQYHSERVNWLG
jgi:hypothetical protein